MYVGRVPFGLGIDKPTATGTTTWTRVLVRNPETMNPEPLPGYVWLDGPGKVLHDPATALVVILSAARKPLRSAQDDAPFFPQWPSRRLDTPRHSAP
jgi:hypothetical protein